jgi:membrane-associated phospholipid phosphatase
VTASVPSTFADRVLQDVTTTDLAIYRAIAASPTPTLDRALRGLSKAANHSKLWLAIAGALAVSGGDAERRAAARGLASIGVASAVVNIAAKSWARRQRPDPVANAVPAARHLRMPTSSSFPSGHAASAQAFASAVGSELPWLSLPLQALATSVAYSRVHTGVHFPADVIVGAGIGASCAALVEFTARRPRRRRR